MIPHIDFLRADKYLIPGVELKIRLIKANNNFSLIMDADRKAEIKVKKLELRTRKVTIVNDVILHNEKLMESKPAMYHLQHSKLKTTLINSGTQTTYIGQVIRGKFPRSFLFAFVESASIDGAHGSNPFVFPHFDLNYFQVVINGEPLHSRALQPDFTDGSAITYFKWFLDNTGQKYKASNGVTYEEFIKNTFFLCYDLSPDQSNGFYKFIQDNGTVDIHLGFKKPLTKNVTMITFATYSETLCIDKNRNITIV